LTAKPSVLVYGYGNPGRQDDGLGVMLAEIVEAWGISRGYESLHTDSNYQLNLEDADALANHDLVIFADASGEDMEDFRLEVLEPSPAVEFTMHAVSPAFILHLCHQMFDKKPETYLLHIRGYEWEFMGTMTEGARRNLEKAVAFVKEFLGERL
jgi:hydrogenase maturation protease